MLQIIDAKAGTLENVVDLGLTKVRAQATCKAISDVRTDVAINSAGLYTGPLKVPLGVQVRQYQNGLQVQLLAITLSFLMAAVTAG
jgi:hypothetical protein